MSQKSVVAMFYSLSQLCQLRYLYYRSHESLRRFAKLTRLCSPPRKRETGPLLVLHRTDGAHRRMLYLRPRQSRLHLNLFIKNGERGSLRGALKSTSHLSRCSTNTSTNLREFAQLVIAVRLTRHVFV